MPFTYVMFKTCTENMLVWRSSALYIIFDANAITVFMYELSIAS